MAKLNCIYKTKAEEASIDACGYNFLCIYGSHVNGNYISIINWNVSAELSDPKDIVYNSNSISEGIQSISELNNQADQIAKEIAEAIQPRLQRMQNQRQRNDFIR